MASHRILDRGAVRDEARRTILREAEHRYRNELLDDEERQVLRNRPKKSFEAIARYLTEHEKSIHY